MISRGVCIGCNGTVRFGFDWLAQTVEICDACGYEGKPRHNAPLKPPTAPIEERQRARRAEYNERRDRNARQREQRAERRDDPNTIHLRLFPIDVRSEA